MPRDIRKFSSLAGVIAVPFVLCLVDRAAFTMMPRDSGLAALISGIGLVFIAPSYVAFIAVRSSSVFTIKIAFAAVSLLLCWTAAYVAWGLWSGRILHPDDETVVVMMGEIIAGTVFFAASLLAFSFGARCLRQRPGLQAIPD